MFTKIILKYSGVRVSCGEDITPEEVDKKIVEATKRAVYFARKVTINKNVIYIDNIAAVIQEVS